MSEHSIVPPSSAQIWGAPDGCTGWPKMNAQFPDESGEAAKDGTASHYVAENMIKVGRNPAVNVEADFIGRTALNGIVITEEMTAAARVYADNVVEEFEARPQAFRGVEVKLPAPAIHPENFGTMDAVLYDSAENEVILWDYKYGRAIVEAYHNWQAINYLSAVVSHLNITDPTTRVQVRIVQPRAFHRDGVIRIWRTTLNELYPFFATLSENARIAMSDLAETRSGLHCRYCSARAYCQAALTAGLQMFEAVDKPLVSDPTPAQLGGLLALVQRARKQLEYLESGYEEEIKSLIRSGKAVPGWSVATGYGHRQWKADPADVYALGELMGVDLREVKPVTPSQAEKLGMNKEIIAAYTETPQRGTKLKYDDGSKAKQIFNGE